MNISLQFDPLDCSFYDWPSANYAVQPPASLPPPLLNSTNSNNIYDINQEEAIVDTKKQKLKLRCLHAIDELLQTERDYTNHLGHLVNVCFGQILQQQKWMLDDHKNTIKRNANDLLQFHNNLLTALEKVCNTMDIQTKCGDIAAVFLDMGSSFTLYDAYCDKHDAAIVLCNNYRSKPEWITFVKDCIATPTLCSDPNLDQGTKPLYFEDYLIKPVQRVCRYQLLLKEILHYTPHGSIEYKRLNDALEMMQTVVAGIDRRKYHRDTVERTRLFIDRLDLSSSDGRLNRDSLYLLGNLLMAGVIDVTYSSLGQTTVGSSSRSKYLGCFIFSTYLIMVRPKKVTCYTPKHWFPLRLTELEDLQDISDQRENAFVVRCKKHCFVFTATCQREKRLWMTKLSEAIVTARSKPKSVDTIIGSSLQGISKPTKLRTSRSVTNLLDFHRENTSLCSGSTSWLHQQYSTPSPRLEKQQQRSDHSLIEGSSLHHHADAIRRSKSLSLQLASYYKTSDDEILPQCQPTSSSPPVSHKSIAGKSLPQYHPHVEHIPPVPSVKSATLGTSVKATTILTKRHSADFIPRTKKREQLKSRIHSEMYIKPLEIGNDGSPSSTKLQQLQSGSMDLISTSSSQSSLNMIGKIKSNHQHAMRIGADHKLKEVCTQDYLASRSWSTLLRASSNGQSFHNNSNNTSSNTNTSTNGNTNGDNRGHRKSSFSNLRSSSSSFILMGNNPCRRISNGSNTRSDISVGITSAPTNSSTSTLDDSIKHCKRSSIPQPQRWKHRPKKRLSSSSTLSSSTLSSTSSSSAASCIATTNRIAMSYSPSKMTTKVVQTKTPISSYGSLDFQQYYCGKFGNDTVTNGLLPTMTINCPTHGVRGDINQCLLCPNQKKKPLRSSLSSYSLHIQPMTSNVKHAFVDGLRRLSPSQKQQQYTLNGTSTKQIRQSEYYSNTSSPVSGHHHYQTPTRTQGSSHNVIKRSSRLFSWIKNDDESPKTPPSTQIKYDPSLSCNQSRSAIITTMVDNMTTKTLTSTMQQSRQQPSKPNWSRKWMPSRK